MRNNLKQDNVQGTEYTVQSKTQKPGRNNKGNERNLGV